MAFFAIGGVFFGVWLRIESEKGGKSGAGSVEEQAGKKTDENGS